MEFLRSEKFPHVAPELFHEAKCSPKSDIYSFCNIIKLAYGYMRVKFDRNLMFQGMDRVPSNRPSLPQLKSFLRNELQSRGWGTVSLPDGGIVSFRM